MKVGDLASVLDDTCENGHWCSCWFCYHNSTRMGIILEKLSCGQDGTGYWDILFDAGAWRLHGSEIKIIN